LQAQTSGILRDSQHPALSKKNFANLEQLQPQSRSIHRCLRLYGGGQRSFPHPLYIVLLEIGSRRILHCNVTAHPTADWTLQQFREAIPSQHRYRALIHDRHGTFSAQLDQAVEDLGIRVLKTPPRVPQANAFCERLIGTIRR
jgi:transposase InsO family protein